jgi:hypothetical protein
MEEQLSGWKRDFLRAHERIVGMFARSEPRKRSLAYAQGRLRGCQRKNGWQLAERMGEAKPDPVQTCWIGPAGMRIRCGARCAIAHSLPTMARDCGSAGQGSKGERL